MDSKENTDCSLDDLELPAAKKICLDNNDVSNSSRDNSSVSDSTLNLGDLFSHRQSLSSCSINDRVDNSTFSPPIHTNQIADENKSGNEDGDKIFTFASSETDDNSVASTIMSDSNNEYVKNDENDKKNCSSKSNLNFSNLSTRAFTINESLGFMDETCLDESHSEDIRKGNSFSFEVKSPSHVTEEGLEITDSESIHNLVNCVAENCNDLIKISDNDSSSKLEVTLDYTCKQEVVGEGTLDLCHSTIKKDAMFPSSKLFLDPSLTSMSIDESLVTDLNNIPCQPSQEASEQLCNNSNSTNLFNEVSGCALDYTCSKSVAFDVNGTFTGTLLPNTTSETSINVLECPNNEQQDTNRSNSMITLCNDLQSGDNVNVELKDDLNTKENCVPDPENPINDLYDLSDLKNSFMSNKTFSADEVKFLKENLLKVMELLKNDNNSFESFKLASEYEKRELLEKIKYLESRDHQSCADILTFKKSGLEGKIDQCENYDVLSEELTKTTSHYNNLLQLVLVTKGNWLENKLFVDFLSDLNIAHDELFIPITAENDKFVINHKKVYDLMLSLFNEIFKNNLFKQEYNNILKTYRETFSKDEDRLCFIANECEDNLLGNLKTTFEEILNYKNCLEKENAELKAEVYSKSEEIKILSSAVENLNQQLNIVKGNTVISADPIDMNNFGTNNLSREITENLNIHDNVNESNANISVNKKSLDTSKKDLSPSKENYDDICLKCVNYELELRKMREAEHTFQELLLHHDVLKTDVDSKCCEIEKLNKDNRCLLSQIDYLMCKIRSRGIDCDESELKVKFEADQNSFVEHEKMLVSDDQTGKDLSFKHAKSDENIDTTTNNLSMMETLVKSPQIGTNLYVSFDFSKDEILKLQFDFNCLNKRYSEMLSDFALYKQTYTHTENECILWREEKKSLESNLDSLKSQLAAVVESSKLKCDDEEINNKIKHLMAQILDLESSNANLKTQLGEMHSDSDHYINQLNNEISELKIKLDSVEKLLINHQENFDLYKEKYTFTQEESILWTIEKQSLESEVNSLKSQLQNALKESSKLELDKDEINHNLKKIEDQLYEETLSRQNIQDSYEALKTKYEESVIEINNKTIELQNLIAQLADLESNNANIKSQMSGINNDSDLSINLLNNEISELKIRLESTQKLLKDHEKKYDELKVSYDNICKDLESKSTAILSLTDNKEKLEKELEIFCQNDTLLKQKISELQENRDYLESQFLSTKDEVSKLQLDLNCQNEKHTELLSNFDLYKQKYNFSEDEYMLWREEKKTLENELDSLKSQLESALEESSKLKLENVEINQDLRKIENQLCEEKLSYKDIQDSYEALKTKYEESVVEINNKTIELQNLFTQITDLESSNANLKTQISGINNDSDHNTNLLNNEIDELKLRFESTEKLLKDYEKKYDELKVSYDNICENLESKSTAILSLTDNKEKLEKELEIFCQNDTLLKQKIAELQENRDYLESQFLSSKDEVSKLQLDLNYLNEKHTELISNFDIYKQKYTFSEYEHMIWREEKKTLENELDSLKSQLESALEESSKLKLDNEEINNNLKKIENQLCEEKQSHKDIQDSYEILKSKYEESSVGINNQNIELQNLLAQLADIETNNANLKTQISEIKSNSDHNINLLNNEVSELKMKLYSTETILTDHEKKHSELKLSYDELCEDLRSKNLDLSLLIESKEKLEKELQTFIQNDVLLKKNVEELKKERDSFESKFFSSEDKVSKLQLDLNCLNEKHTEFLSNFDLYKQKYTFSEDEYALWREEKQSLESELDSLKSQLESALEESSKLKLDNEEINDNLKKLENQLCEEKQISSDIRNSYENLKTKYEESSVEINNKIKEVQNLLGQITDLETTNENLKTELNNFFNNADSNIDLLNNEISELKMKLDSTETLLTDHEKKHSELKLSYDEVCENLRSKNLDLSSLIESKEKLETELEKIIQNDALLKQNVEELKKERDSFESKFLSSEDKVSKLQLDLNCLYEKHTELLSNFDLYKQKYTFSEDEYVSWREEKQSLESDLDSLKSQLESALEESSKLKLDNEDINNNLKKLENQLCEEKQISSDIRNSYENLKTKYEESVVEKNNKTMKLQSSLAQLSELKTSNGNLKNYLNILRSDSNNNIDLINQELSKLKRKCETSEKLITDYEKKYGELQISYDKICEDLESKNAELSLLMESKNHLEKELETFHQNDTLLKQNIEELQKNHDGLKNQLLSSKDEVCKLQSDFDSLKEKNSEMLSDFSFYKETYTRTESEFVVLKEQKQSLECESDSLKSKLECALEELQTLKSDYEENTKIMKNIENQLFDEKKNFKDIQNSYENLKMKYEESDAVINDKMIEIQNLLGQLSDLETINVNLKSELNVIRSDSEHNIDVLNKKVIELKEKYETSDKSLVDLQEKHNELKVSYNQICVDLASKNAEFLLLTSSKEHLEKEIDSLRQNSLSLKKKLTDLETNEELYKKTMLDLNIQLDSVNSKVDYMKNIEMQIGVLKDEYDILSLYHAQNKKIDSEQPFCLFSEFVNTVEAIIKDFIALKEKSSEEEMKLSSSLEEVSRLNILLESLKEEIKLKTEESVKLQENYSSLSKQYNCLLDSSKDSNIRCNTLLEKLKELETQNSFCQSAIQELKSDVTAKESIIASLSNIKELHELTVNENKALSSQLKEKIEEYETIVDKVKNSEEKYLNLKLEHNTLTDEINVLRNKNEALEMKYNENYALYINSKDNIEVLQKEKEEIRKNFIKCEKDYQNSLDLVKKCQENMGNLDKQYNLSIAKLNVILKEKESYESQNLSLQKINDELMNRIKELNFKCQENQNMLMKFKELEKSYETVCSKHQCLEKQLIDYENLKRENEDLKSQVSEKDLFSTNLSQNYNALSEKYNLLSDELKTLSSAVLTLVPGENSAIETIKLVGEKLQAMKKIENDLEEEKMKCENLDEECNLLNEDLKYKDVVIGDMYKDHSSKMNELKELLKKEENLRQEILLENSTLKDKIRCLDSEICKLKTTEKSACSSCAELKGVLQKLKVDLVDNSSKVTTLQLQIEENEIQNKKKIQDYRKKISSLQEELGAALNKLEDNRLKNEVAHLNASVQTESLPVQISGQSGIVQSFKIKEQEEKIKKFEKENLVLKRMCQSRLQTIQELKTKLENVSKPQKTQRNVLEEVQNHHSS